MSLTLTGAGAAPGVAVARPFVISPTASAVQDPGPVGPPEAEKTRVHRAMAQAAEELYELADRVRATAGDEAEIFEAHAAFAEDPELEHRADELIDAGHSAIAATIAAFGAFRQLLAASTSEYLAARAADLDDVCARVTMILAGAHRGFDLPEEPTVLLARELTPSQTAEMPRERIAALVTETGSPTSHAAILARTLGMPAVVGVTGLLDLAAGAGLVAVDGRSGDVHVDPDDELLGALLERQAGERARRAELAGARHQRACTADGVHIALVANIAGREDLAAANEAGAEGAGLVRTELLFQDRRSEPSVEEQAAYYGAVLDAFPRERVVFRTLDIGADKPMPFFTRPPEPNPALGLRGIRLSLRHPKLFERQLRALVRAYGERVSSGRMRMGLMFPLVSRVEEVTAARAELERVAEDEGVEVSALEVGVMIEVPSAALAARRIAPHVDFFSIGTNDLLQYLFAADRLGAEVAELADICEPVVLELVAQVVAAAAETGAWVGVCGETASDPIIGAAFVGLGVRELSMVAGAIGEVKDVLRRHTLTTMTKAAEAARLAPSAVAARAALASALN